MRLEILSKQRLGWLVVPYLQPVDCPCGKLATSHWTLTLGTADLKQLILKERGDLQFKPLVARFPERICDLGGDCSGIVHAGYKTESPTNWLCQ